MNAYYIIRYAFPDSLMESANILAANIMIHETLYVLLSGYTKAQEPPQRQPCHHRTNRM